MPTSGRNLPQPPAHMSSLTSSSFRSYLSEAQSITWRKCGVTERCLHSDLLEAGLNEAALRRTLSRAGCQQQCERDEERGWGHKEMTYDPPSQNDARGTRASQLRSDYQRLLHPDDRGLRALF